MTKKQVIENLENRITNLAIQEIDNRQSEWGIGYDTGYRQACLQILEMLRKY